MSDQIENNPVTVVIMVAPTLNDDTTANLTYEMREENRVIRNAKAKIQEQLKEAGIKPEFDTVLCNDMNITAQTATLITNDWRHENRVLPTRILEIGSLFNDSFLFGKLKETIPAERQQFLADHLPVSGTVLIVTTSDNTNPLLKSLSQGYSPKSRLTPWLGQFYIAQGYIENGVPNFTVWDHTEEMVLKKGIVELDMKLIRPPTLAGRLQPQPQR